MAKKYLIIQTAFIGDVILATPIIENLKKSNPENTIDFLLKKENTSVLKGNQKIRKVYTLDKSNKLKSIYSLIKAFRKNRYDVIINLHRFASSGIVSTLSKGRETIGFNKNPFSLFYTKKIEHKIEAGVHEIERNLKLIEELCPITIKRPFVEISNEVHVGLKKYQSRKYYCLAPASVWATKEAPVKIWQNLIIKLNEENVPIYLIGGPDDFDKCQNIIDNSASSNLVNLCGKLSLIESAGLMQNAIRNFVNDSAPMHLASAVNAPVTAFYCSTSPAFGFGPLSDDSEIIEVKNLECKPCGLHGHKACPKGHFKCGNELDLG